MSSLRASIMPGCAVLFALAACNHTTPAAYHEAAAHPVVLSESKADVTLAGLDAAGRDQRAAQFAANRPNDGSSFTVAGDAVTAEAVRRVLLANGVAAQDIAVVAAATPGITRIDRIAHVAGCEVAPEAQSLFGELDDGLQHSNANSALLGCATRRNIAAMTADPRSLFVAGSYTGRDGARAADVYGKYTKGQHTEVPGDLLAPRTADLGDGGNQQ
jgi:pilus biogenesis lipoprotein CpaD